MHYLLLAAALLATGAATAQQPPAAPVAPPVQPAALSTAAERVYDYSKPRIVQIRTLLQAAGRQSSLGSGFW